MLQKSCSALENNHPPCEIQEAKGKESIWLPGGFKARGKMPANTSQGCNLSPGRVEMEVWPSPCCLGRRCKVTAHSSALPEHPPVSRYSAIWM